MARYSTTVQLEFGVNLDVTYSLPEIDGKLIVKILDTRIQGKAVRIKDKQELINEIMESEIS